MIKTAVVSSVETTFIHNNIRNETSAVGGEVDGLEQDGTLGRLIISIGSFNFKTEQHVDNAPIGAVPTEAMTDDSHMEVDDLEDFDISYFDSEEKLNEYFASSAYVRYDNLMDGSDPSKV